MRRGELNPKLLRGRTLKMISKENLDNLKIGICSKIREHGDCPLRSPDEIYLRKVKEELGRDFVIEGPTMKGNQYVLYITGVQNA